MHRLDVNVGSVITALTLVTLHTSKPLCMCIDPTHSFASRKPYDYDHMLLPMEVISGCGIHRCFVGIQTHAVMSLGFTLSLLPHSTRY